MKPELLYYESFIQLTVFHFLVNTAAVDAGSYSVSYNIIKTAYANI